jgi:PKD repeat protein
MILFGVVAAMPVAQFLMTPDPAAPGVPVVVDGSASWADPGVIVSYLWDFGDGIIAFGPTLDHTYWHFGLFTVSLTVQDDSGLTGTTQLEFLSRQVILITLQSRMPEDLTLFRSVEP